ncbi:MAG: glycoside hydrolase family 2 protein [Clostridiales bacterium]|nr:glycoside hydrolase family 2 protein [Clostridiales bacterium]
MTVLPISFNAGWTYSQFGGNNIFDPTAQQMERIPVTLPHDATIHETRTADASGGTSKGYYPSRDYDYFKSFDVPEGWMDKRVFLRFEGVYMNARVFVNGDYAGGRANGYAEFAVPLNDFLRYGASNEIKVSVQTGEDSRWYAGAGLYREVSLFVADPLHIDMDGFVLDTLAADEQVASVQSKLTVVNDGVRTRAITVEIELKDADGNVACRDTQKLTMRALTAETIYARLYVKQPRLWSPDAPNLYTATAKLVEDGEIVDEDVIETFGLRVLTLDNVRGLAVNGKTVKLYGGCIHHDNGVIGAATIERAEDRRAQLMRQAGYNALRSAHHPMSRAMLRACDRHGLLVMDELTDMWNISKTRRDFGASFEAEWRADVESMVRKDLNHPCVVMYSMGNEIPESGSPAGAAIYRRLAALTRSLDGTRYITAGLNNLLAGDAMQQIMQSAGEGQGGGINDIMGGDLGDVMAKMSMHPLVVAATNESYESMDICGYNYAADRYLHDCAKFTNWITVGSETFPKDLAYNWKIVMEDPGAIGDFVWTSWDYLGEAGIGRDHYAKGEQAGFGQNPFPWRIAWDADFDITGVRTPQGFYREIVVGHRSAPYVAMQTPATYDMEPKITAWSWPGTVSSWNWPGYEGKPIRIDVYGRGDEAELIVNGESLGRKPLPKETTPEGLAFKATFDAVYAPGRVEAVVYEDGRETGRACVATAGAPTQAEVTVDRERICANERDLAYVDVWLKDADGNVNRGAARTVTVTVEGAGVLQGLGSGDPCSDEDFFADSCQTFFGHAQAVIRPTGVGKIHVIVSCEGCETVLRTIEAE